MKHILFSSDISEVYGSYDTAEATAREMLQETFEPDEITEDMIYNALYDDIEFMHDDFIRDVSRVDGKWLVLADLGLWTGRAPGGRVFDNLHSAIEAICNNMEWVTISEDQHGNIHARCIHHDGCNMFDLYRLSARGEEWYYNNEYNLDWEEICTTLAKPHNRRAGRLRKAFGWI